MINNQYNRFIVFSYESTSISLSPNIINSFLFLVSLTSNELFYFSASKSMIYSLYISKYDILSVRLHSIVFYYSNMYLIDYPMIPSYYGLPFIVWVLPELVYPYANIHEFNPFRLRSNRFYPIYSNIYQLSVYSSNTCSKL